ncbi:MAG TPA: MFS transporter [Streptosporangiaceae bacterium]|jgi:EmrB/QacA subfamily drug resistance transporter|nr:MFS transporter [Streptosporangiaceae bacterium]
MATTLSSAEKTSARPGSRHPGLALLVIATAQLMVILDATIVNVALPHIQTALRFSDSGLEWVVNGYALTLGGLLLLGGRAGDLLGRRRMFIIGLLLFSAASLAGGLATSQAWLLAARAVQGAGGAIVTPTALALVFTTFPEGRARHRALGIYSAMSVAGGAVGLLAGGLLVTYVSWRWVLFVNVPIGIAGAVAARAVLPAGGRRPGRLDLPGIITGTGGVAALVYGLSNAATGQDGTSHWGDAKVLATLAGGAAALAAFGFIEARTRHALLPLRLLRDRNRVGANLMSLGAGTTLFGVFFFLTLFVQDVWNYSPLRAGLAFLPLTIAVLVTSIASTRLVSLVGRRPLLLAGTVISGGGLYWMSRLTEHGSYAGGLLGPILVIGAGLGLLFVPMSLAALSGVAEADSGVASSLLNATRQIGGSIGLAVLGTVAWTVVANRALPAKTAAAYSHALAVGFDRAFLVAAGIMLLMLVAAVALVRDRRASADGLDTDSGGRAAHQVEQVGQPLPDAAA